MRFQIFFEGQGWHFIWKRAVPEQCPWPVFCGVRRFSGVVIGQALPQVFTCAGIFLLGMALAAQDVDVPHADPAAERVSFHALAARLRQEAMPGTLRFALLVAAPREAQRSVVPLAGLEPARP